MAALGSLVACSKEAEHDAASSTPSAESALATDATPASVTPALAPVAPEPPAANADLVRRFGDEARLDNPKERLVHGPALVRLDPASTRTSAFLLPPTELVLVARANVGERSWVLVNYGSPFDETIRLNGWIPAEALSGEPPRERVDGGTGGAAKASKPATHCAKEEVLVWSHVAACERACADDSGCAAGARCFGIAPEFVQGGIGKFASYCVGSKQAAATSKRSISN